MDGPGPWTLHSGEVPAGSEADNPFFATWEGYLELDAPASIDVNLYLDTIHDFGDAGTITHTREYQIRVPGRSTPTVALNVFDSVSEFSRTTYQDVAITDDLLGKPFHLTLRLRVDPADTVVTGSGLEAFFYQLREGPTAEDTSLKQRIDTALEAAGYHVIQLPQSEGTQRILTTYLGFVPTVNNDRAHRCEVNWFTSVSRREDDLERGVERLIEVLCAVDDCYPEQDQAIAQYPDLHGKSNIRAGRAQRYVNISIVCRDR